MLGGDGQRCVTVVSLVNESNLLDLDKVMKAMAKLRDETALSDRSKRRRPSVRGAPQRRRADGPSLVRVPGISERRRQP